MLTTAAIRWFNPIWNFRDLTGLPLDDTYYAFFLENTFPYVPVVIYQDQDATIPLANPVQLSAAGTLGPDLYFTPATVIRIEIRAGNSQADALIWEIDNYAIGEASGGSTPSGNTTTQTDNLISNPQFAYIDFTSPVTLNGISNTTVSVIPGWDIVLTGTGNLTLTQVEFTQSIQTPNNAPYGLQIGCSSFTSATLVQTFAGNGYIWSNSAVAFNISMRTADGSPYTINVNLVTNTDTFSLATFQLTPAYVESQTALTLPASANSNPPETAFTAINISLPPNGIVGITSVQLLAQDTALIVPYEQEPLSRQEDHLFHYYYPQIVYRPSTSLLVAWDFPLNPRQLGNSGNITSTPAYIWDQTIGVVSTTTCAYALDTVSHGLNITLSGTNNAVGILQYLSGDEARKMIGTRLAANVNAYSTNSTVTVRVYMYRGPAASTIPSIITSPAIIGTLVDSGVFTLNSTPITQGWTEILRGGSSDNVAISALTKPVITTSSENDYSFNGWQITDSAQINDTDKYAIVVTFGYTATGGNLTINSASTVPGDIASRPGPQTRDEVLRESRRYYEQSYEAGVPVGTAPSAGLCTVTFAAITTDAVSDYNVYGVWGDFDINYLVTKRIAPVTTIYNGNDGTINQVFGNIIYNGGPLTGSAEAVATVNTTSTLNQYWLKNPGVDRITVSGQRFNSSGTFPYAPSADGIGNAPPWPYSRVLYHYVADARLGVV